jgi:hypothetical protein
LPAFLEKAPFDSADGARSLQNILSRHCESWRTPAKESGAVSAEFEQPLNYI